MELTFTNPQYLWILLAIPLLAITHIFTLKKSRKSALKFANFEALERVSKGVFLGTPYSGLLKSKNLLLLFLRLLTYTIFILSIAGITLWYVGEASDYDYVLAMDTSSSMLAEDFEINRLESAKGAALLFVDSVPKETQIGILSFAGTVFVDSKPSKEHDKTKEIIRSLDIKQSGGTNIGDAIISGTNLFTGEQAKTIILLTDGQSNIGTPVQEAINYAKNSNVIINTIGMGTEEGGQFTDVDIILKLDEAPLIDISNQTKGKYFKAEDKASLEISFKEIASATERDISFDLSPILLFIGICLLSLEWILLNTKYRTIA